MSRLTAKVEELLRMELAKLILKEIPEELGIISITRVVVMPDLKTAQIYISAIFPENELAILLALKNQTHSFQQTLGRKLKLRYTPRLTFEFDRQSHEIDKVEALLKEIHRGT
jgi:ribosome-binding factor A